MNGAGGELGPIVAPGLHMLFVGINPSLRSAEAGHHFARPGNRFWPALQAAGFRPRLLRPDEDGELPTHGVLNAHYKPADFARLYAEARAYIDAMPPARAAPAPPSPRPPTPR